MLVHLNTGHGEYKMGGHMTLSCFMHSLLIHEGEIGLQLLTTSPVAKPAQWPECHLVRIAIPAIPQLPYCMGGTHKYNTIYG